MPSSIVRKAVVPVAGFGTSFLPETKTMPKAMLPIVDIPAIQFVIEEITKSGIEGRISSIPLLVISSMTNWMAGISQ